MDEKEYIWILLYPKDKLYNTKFSKGKCGGDTLTGNMSQEIHDKISASKLSGNNPRAERVKATNVKTGEVFIFDSMCECARELKLNDHTCVSKRCLGKAKKPYKKTWNFEFYIEQQSVSTIPDECKGVG